MTISTGAVYYSTYASYLIFHTNSKLVCYFTVSLSSPVHAHVAVLAMVAAMMAAMNAVVQ
jgi:Na+/proline symporter